MNWSGREYGGNNVNTVLKYEIPKWVRQMYKNTYFCSMGEQKKEINKIFCRYFYLKLSENTSMSLQLNRSYIISYISLL